MRLIDADKLPKYTGLALSAVEVATAVENAPTVDAVPVVRCKDCAHYYCILNQGSQFERGLCEALNDLLVRPNDYCSQGERKEKESGTTER